LDFDEKTFYFSIDFKDLFLKLCQCVSKQQSKRYDLFSSVNSHLALVFFSYICKPIFNFELTQYKKSKTNPLQIQQHFAEIRSVTSDNSAICTGGSKDSDIVPEITLIRRGNELHSKKNCISLYTENRTGRW
jgi:hypothetical protein